MTFELLMPEWHNKTMKTLAERIRTLRESNRKKSNEMCRDLDLASGTVSRWESGSREPDIDMLKKIAKYLNTSIAYLTGETNDVKPYSEINIPVTVTPQSTAEAGLTVTVKASDKPLESNVHLETEDPEDVDAIKIPVLSPEQTACCGKGIPVTDATYQAEEYISVNKQEVGRLCNSKMPFAVKADGDSMTGWGILNGSRVIINPVEDIHDFDIVLVCYRDNLVLKKIQRMQDGSVRLYAADSTCITVPAEDASVDTLFTIWGKAMSYDYHKSGRIVHGL